jgi:hypothetical protein
MMCDEDWYSGAVVFNLGSAYHLRYANISYTNESETEEPLET